MTTPSAVEQMLRDCIPGGSICDPQQVADNIREWFSLRQPVSDAEVSALEGRLLRSADSYAAMYQGDREDNHDDMAATFRGLAALLRRRTAGAREMEALLREAQERIGFCHPILFSGGMRAAAATLEETSAKIDAALTTPAAGDSA